MKTVCFIQMHYTELELAERINPISRLKRSGIFDNIVLAVAEIEENKPIADFARANSIECYFGSVDNLVDRMSEVCKGYDILVRVLATCFYMDIDLIRKQVEFAKGLEEFHYVNLPRDFDIKFGADVFSVEGLKRLPGSFRPFIFAEQNLKTVTFEDVPEFSKTYFNLLREQMHEYSPPAWNYGSNFCYHEYENAKKYLDNDEL